jgi:hypothetical protein
MGPTQDGDCEGELMAKIQFGLFVLLTALVGSAAKAEDAVTTSDLRCLVVASTLSNSTNESFKAAGTVSAFYYMGRLDGRAPDLDLENRLFAEALKMTPEDILAQARICRATLAKKTRSMQEMGRHMEERAKQPPGG